jgi:hypothetical protein
MGPPISCNASPNQAKLATTEFTTQVCINNLNYSPQQVQDNSFVNDLQWFDLSFMQMAG